MFACFQRIESLLSMPMIGCGNGDRIDGIVSQHFFIVTKYAWFAAGF